MSDTPSLPPLPEPADSDWSTGERIRYFTTDQMLSHREEYSAPLASAILRLLRSFPTDSDMHEAGWEACEINEACAAYDAAQRVLSLYSKD
jgi:hypothetical protein